MAWIQIDNAFIDHDKVVEIEDRYQLAAVGIQVAIIGWCDQHNTDGVFTERVCAKKLPSNWRKPFDELVRVGLVDKSENGFVIHDYLDWQDSAAVKKGRSDRQRAKANARWAKEHGIAASNAAGNAAGIPAAMQQDLQDIQEEEQRAREDLPEAKIISGDTDLPPCLLSEVTTADPPYTGTCYGFIVAAMERQFGTLPSHSELAQLKAAINDGCIPGCDGTHPADCAFLIAYKLANKGKTTFSASNLWLKCIREDRMEVRQK